MKMSKKNKKKKIGRPFAPLYLAACVVLRPIWKLKYNLKIDNSAMKGDKGPALVLGQHLSNYDHVLTGLTLFPRRPNFVASEHFLLKPALRFVFKIMHVITKKMFCADVPAILNMMRAKAEGNTIVLFPEGRLPANGMSAPVTAGTAELVKKLGINVYLLRGEGTYKTFPKWGKKARKGKISVRTDRIFTAEELKTLTVKEIGEKLDRVFVHDDETSLPDVVYRSKDTTAGLDGILWKCPECGAEGTLVTGKSKIVCPCGMEASLGEDWRLTGSRFARVNEWYLWQREELWNGNDSLETECVIGTPDEKGDLIPDAGQGRMKIDKETFTLTGTLLGEEITVGMPLDKLGGFPITVSQHVDIYDKNRLLYLYPTPDPRTSMRWVAWLDRYHIV